MNYQNATKPLSGRRGFTIVEVLIAMMVMTIAVLALASSSGLVAKMMTRGHNAEMAASFAMRRLDVLRLSGCTGRADGADTLFRGGSNWAAVNNWVWTTAPGATGTYRVKVTTSYRSSGGTIGTNISETSISCVF
jgi:prepilin-type N-terminal cleavage/methylation domain-containing protein